MAEPGMFTATFSPRRNEYSAWVRSMIVVVPSFNRQISPLRLSRISMTLTTREVLRRRPRLKQGIDDRAVRDAPSRAATMSDITRSLSAGVLYPAFDLLLNPMVTAPPWR